MAEDSEASRPNRRTNRFEGLDLAVVGLVVAGSLAPAVLLIYPSPARTLAVFAFAFVGVGSSVMCHVKVADRMTAWALAVVLSMAASGLAAAVMVWSSSWHPFGLLWGCVPCAASCLVRLLRAAFPGIDLRACPVKRPG